MPDQTRLRTEKDWNHWRGILSGQITRACLDNGMSEPDAAETAAVVLVKVIEEHGWQVIPPPAFPTGPPGDTHG